MMIQKKTCNMLLSLILILGILVGCEEQEGIIIPPTTDEVAYLVSTMTLREKIGQMIMLDFRKWVNKDQANEDGMKVLSLEAEEILTSYHIGGVILFSENISDVVQSVNLNNQIQNSSSNGIPLLIGLDEESLAVTRLKEGVALPENMAIGALNDADYAFDSTSKVGKELRSRGFNMNFAPYLDVNSNPTNPIIGTRAFGSLAELVSKLGVAAMQGYQMQGIIPAIKHFPGHGDTNIDPQTTLSMVDKSKKELLQMELKPFKSAIENGVDVIMAGHIQLPKVETTRVISKTSKERVYLPATLSYEILTNLLRREMGFTGVIITDSLNTDVIRENFGEGETVIRAINAGADILMMPTELRSSKDIYKLESIYEEIENAVAKGSIKISEIDDSVRRILNLKQKRGLLSNNQIFDPKIAESVVALKDTIDLERRISQEAVTCLKNDVVNINGNDRLLLPYETTDKTIVSIFTPNSTEGIGLEYGIRKSEELYNFKLKEYRVLVYSEAEVPSEENIEIVKQSDIVIIYTDAKNDYKEENWAVSYPKKLIEILKEKDIPYVIICGGLPYEAALYSEEPAVLVSYSMKNSSEILLEQGLYSKAAYSPNTSAVLDVIFGKIANKGELPVEIRTINEDGVFEEKICFPIGTGIKLSFIH